MELAFDAGTEHGAAAPAPPAFDVLYARTYEHLVSYCRRHLGTGAAEAEEVAQEAFLRAWSSWASYSRNRPFWPWLATIARRLCIDNRRRHERGTARTWAHSSLCASAAPSPEEVVEAGEEQRKALAALRRLPPNHQRVVSLRDIEGWSYDQIAAFEGVTVESVRASLRRGRVALRKAYGQPEAIAR